MKPAPFRYERPTDLEQAVSLLAEHGSEAKVLAGGQSLVPLLNMRLARPSMLVDITRIAQLQQMKAANGHLAIGAAVRDRQVELWADGCQRCPLLAEAVGWIGHVEIRNAGTVCGSLAHADPAAELPLVAVALEADLVVRSSRGERIIPAAEFFVTYLTTALAEDELLTEARLPVPGSETGWAFAELARRHGDFALVAVAALLERGQDDSVSRARLVLGGVDATPVRAKAAEQALSGQRLTSEHFAEAGRLAADNLDPPTDVQASGGYRKKLAAVLVERALAAAAGRLPGQRD